MLVGMNTQSLVPIGVGIVMVGMIIIIIGSLLSANSGGNSKVAVGGVIGFIPFGFGNDKGMVIAMIVISVVFALIFYFSNFLR